MSKIRYDFVGVTNYRIKSRNCINRNNSAILGQDIHYKERRRKQEVYKQIIKSTMSYDSPGRGVQNVNSQTTAAVT